MMVLMMMAHDDGAHDDGKWWVKINDDDSWLVKMVNGHGPWCLSRTPPVHHQPRNKKPWDVVAARESVHGEEPLLPPKGINPQQFSNWEWFINMDLPHSVYQPLPVNLMVINHY